MSEPDISDLLREKLPEGAFPADRNEAYRVYLADPVHQGVLKHAAENVAVEICGVLVGKWARDANGPFALISEYIRCNQATQKFAEVTFTHDSWAQINHEMDHKFKDLRIIGWYHSHPNFGIFLSDRDCFIQQHFFSGPGQIALVVDPIQKTEGVFEWRRGKPTPMHHYWIGNRVHVGPVSQPSGSRDAAATPAAAQPHSGDRESLGSWILPLLLAFCCFLLGWIWAGQRSDWERRQIIEGVVAHYGLWKGVRPGFEEQLAALGEASDKLAKEMTELSKQHVAAAGDGQEETRQQWQKSLEALKQLRQDIRKMAAAFGLNDEERAALLRFIAAKQRELWDKSGQKGKPEAPAAADDATPAPSTKTTDKPSETKDEKTAPAPPAKEK